MEHAVTASYTRVPADIQSFDEFVIWLTNIQVLNESI